MVRLADGSLMVPVGHSGKMTRVDAGDLEIVLSRTWGVRNGYVTTSQHGNRIRLHRLLCGTPDGMVTDHINGDPTDNRRSNLRACVHAENLRNRKCGSPHRKSQYKGVSMHSSGKWRARISVNGRQELIGYYDSETEAARAYDWAARKVFGEFARPNFALAA